MSKAILGGILSRTEVPLPRLVLITGSAEVSGHGVTCALVKSHILAGSEIKYLTTAFAPNILNSIFKEERQGRVNFHDGYSDPCGWEKRESCVLLSEPLDEVFSINDTSGTHRYVLVVDRLDDLVAHQDALKLIRSLHKFSTDASVEQLIVCCGRDCVPEYVISALTHIALAVIHVQPSTPCQCKITLRKPSGKVVQSHEKFTLTPDLKMQDNRTIEKDKGPKEDNSDADAILAAQTTFSLSLTVDQHRSKNMLLLPHTRIQSSGGQIHYTPDDVDDWDEEDPDDDLDI